MKFDITTNDLPKGQDFAPIPEGEYTVKIKTVDLKGTKSGTGKIMNLGLEVLGPSHAGRVIFAGLNVRNQNKVAEEIGLGQLRQVLESVGLERLSDTDELVGSTMLVKVKIETSDGYEPKNVVKSFKAAAAGPTIDLSPFKKAGF